MIHIPCSQSKEKEDPAEKDWMGNGKDSIEYGYEISFIKKSIRFLNSES